MDRKFEDLQSRYEQASAELDGRLEAFIKAKRGSLRQEMESIIQALALHSDPLDQSILELHAMTPEQRKAAFAESRVRIARDILDSSRIAKNR